MCGSPRLCRRRERPLIGARFSRWREERFGRARCFTLRYSVLLSVWVDPSAEHTVEENLLRRIILIYHIAPEFDPTSHADFGAAAHPGVGGGTHRRRATFERC